MGHAGRIVKFIVVGGIGFAADASVLVAAAPYLGAYIGRLASFSTAVTLTWLLNRHFTFSDRRDDRLIKEWGRYISTQAVGAVVNLAIYAACIALSEKSPMQLVIALATGAIGGMIVNYSLSLLIVFRQK